MTRRPDLLGLHEIADRYGLTYPAVRNRRLRGELPPPDWTLSGSPIWRAETVDRWARRVGLLDGEVTP